MNRRRCFNALDVLIGVEDSMERISILDIIVVYFCLLVQPGEVQSRDEMQQRGDKPEEGLE